MDITFTIPDYDVNKGFESQWEYGFEIKIEQKESYIQLTANKEGLISLAKQLLNLAQEDIPKGYHLHYDEYNSLENGSLDMVIQKS